MEKKYEQPPLAKGVFFEKAHPKAPTWIKGRLSIKVQDFIPFAEKNERNNGYIYLDINKTKDGTKFYVTLDTFIPKSQDDGSLGLPLEDDGL